jgi:hypothetical protein
MASYVGICGAAPNLAKKVPLADAGHMLRQERPVEVDR